MLAVDQENQRTYTRSYIEKEIQKRILLHEIKECAFYFELNYLELADKFPLGEQIDTMECEFQMDSPDNALIYLANKIGFDFDKLLEYDKNQNDGFVSEEADGDEDFKAKMLDSVFENEEFPAFSELLADNDLADNDIDSLLNLFKEIESSAYEYLRLAGEHWSESPITVGIMGNEGNECKFTDSLKRNGVMYKKDAFSVEGQSLDLVILFNPDHIDDEYEYFFHDEFKAFALKDMTPVFMVSGVVHYMSDYCSFDNSVYFNSKDSMSQFDADFAHYLIQKCENGLVQSGQVADLMTDDSQEQPICGIAHFDSISRLSDSYNSLEMISHMVESTINIMDSCESSIMGSEIGYDYRDLSTYLDNEIDYVEYKLPWCGIVYAFTEDRLLDIPYYQKADHISESDKKEIIGRCEALGEHFKYAKENMIDEEVKSKFIIYGEPEPLSHAEDLMRLAAYNNFYGMFQSEEQNEESTETI